MTLNIDTQKLTLEQEVIELGQECVVWITGDPYDTEDVKNTTVAMKAIREALRLGQERNNQYKNLKHLLYGTDEFGGQTT